MQNVRSHSVRSFSDQFVTSVYSMFVYVSIYVYIYVYIITYMLYVYSLFLLLCTYTSIFSKHFHLIYIKLHFAQPPQPRHIFTKKKLTVVYIHIKPIFSKSLDLSLNPRHSFTNRKQPVQIRTIFVPPSIIVEDMSVESTSHEHT